MLLYDHIMTLPDEHRFVWKAKTSFAKYAFIVNRYVVPSVMLTVLFGASEYGNGRLIRALTGIWRFDGQGPVVSGLCCRICSEFLPMHHLMTRAFTTVPGVNPSCLRQQWCPSSR